MATVRPTFSHSHCFVLGSGRNREALVPQPAPLWIPSCFGLAHQVPLAYKTEDHEATRAIQDPHLGAPSAPHPMATVHCRALPADWGPVGGPQYQLLAQSQKSQIHTPPKAAQEPLGLLLGEETAMKCKRRERSQTASTLAHPTTDLAWTSVTTSSKARVKLALPGFESGHRLGASDMM